MYDVIIIGAGPIGLACGIAAKREGLRVLIVDKGSIVNSFLGYPRNMEFFSTPDLMEIGGYPFTTRSYKPTREEAIEYYRRVTEAEKLHLRLYHHVKQVDGNIHAFTVVAEQNAGKASFEGKHVIVTTGFFDTPNLLHVPGEILEKVTHYYDEPYIYTGLNLAIVGGNNTAAKAALACYRHGAKVILVAREEEIGRTVKYWIRPDLINRIAEGSITAYFNSAVDAITPATLLLNTPVGPVEIENDAVLALIGYQPDYGFLQSLRIQIGSDPHQTPVFHPSTFETSRAGLYLAGTVCGGLKTNKWFIENGRFHADQIVHHIAHGTVKKHDLETTYWKTAE